MKISKFTDSQIINVERFNRTVRHEWLELHLFEMYRTSSRAGHKMALDIQ